MSYRRALPGDLFIVHAFDGVSATMAFQSPDSEKARALSVCSGEMRFTSCYVTRQESDFLVTQCSR